MIFAAFVVGLPTAASVVSQCHAAYDGLKSYADEGVEDTPEVSNGRHEFRTAFVRPNRLRFTFREHGDEFAFGKDQRWEFWPHAGRHALWSTFSNGIVEQGTLEELFQKPSTNSTMSAAIELLVPNVHPGRPVLDEFKRGMVSGPESVDGASCFVLTVQDFDTTRKMWIDAKTHLVRRYRWFTVESRTRRWKGRQGWSQETMTVTLRPRANPTLDAKAMTFVPPKGVTWTKLESGDTPAQP